MSVHRLEEMLPDEVRERIAACPVLVMPLGTLEWHSYHLPLGLDSLVAGAICERIADLATGILLPTSYWAAGGVPFPYTLTLSGELIEPLLETLLRQFAAMGFRVIVALTGHFGLEQTLILKRAAARVMEQAEVTVLPLTEYDLTTDHDYLGDHAGKGETELLWAIRPDLVHLDRVSRDVPLDGVIGTDPRGTADPARGAELVELIAGRTAEMAERLLRHTSSEQRAAYLGVLDMSVRVLEETARQRTILGKASVPPITTPAYVAYCQALFRGAYADAQRHIQSKLESLSA